MIKISCPTKFWAFALAEQFNKHNLLSGFFTSYASQKNILLKSFIKRIDNENIPAALIYTYLRYAYKARLRLKEDFLLNDEFDKWVSLQLRRNKDYTIFIGWGSISLRSILQAKSDGKVTILERGSSHIQFQNNLLKEEYAKFHLHFEIDPRVIDKELGEYEAVDFISIPSLFVKKSFVQMGIPEKKLIVNNYGSSSWFTPSKIRQTNKPFRVVYFGSMSIRKGLQYLFQALSELTVDYEAWFIGSVDNVIEDLLRRYKDSRWKFIGHVDQSKLSDLVKQCDVFVLPSIEDGFGMVISQSMACGIPVITTQNTGGADIIEEGRTGFIIPIRNVEAIKDRILMLIRNEKLLSELKENCISRAKQLSWNDYGTRYVNFINSLSKER